MSSFNLARLEWTITLLVIKCPIMGSAECVVPTNHVLPFNDKHQLLYFQKELFQKGKMGPQSQNWDAARCLPKSYMIMKSVYGPELPKKSPFVPTNYELKFISGMDQDTVRL